MKTGLILLFLLVLNSCNYSDFANKIRESLSSGDYRFIIEHSDINDDGHFERALSEAYRQGRKEFCTGISIINERRAEGNSYFLTLEEKKARTIIIHYKSEDGKNIIDQIEISVWPDYGDGAFDKKK
jgi:hypothetical protein